MKSHMSKAGRAIAAVLVAASLATPITVWADDGGGRDNRARAQAQAQSQAQSKQAQQATEQAKERERADQAKRDQAKREQEKAREQAAKQANEKAARERAEQAKRAQEAQPAKEQERKEDDRKDNRVLRALDETRDAKPSDHPSGKDRNDERGGSFPQGASRSNPDGGGLDKPFAVDGLAAGSQGHGDFDGNNGCGNDNDFADDNNGNCGGQRNAGSQSQDEKKPEVAGVQVQSDQKEAHGTEETRSYQDKGDKKDERREAVKSDDRHRSKDHRWGVLGRLLEWCRDVLSGAKTEVAGAQVKAPTATPSPTTTGPTPVPTSTPLTQVSGAKALTDHECIASEWHWVMTQLDDVKDAPLAITVTWANGQTLIVDRTAFTGKVAHYATTANLGSAVVNATTVAPAGWSGQFNLSHGPCIGVQGVLGTQATAEPTHTTAPTSTPLPTHTPQPTSTALPTNTATVQPTATLGSGVQAQALVNHECITYEWHWVITQLESEAQAPAFIRVTWANGQTLDVVRTGFSGKTAHYTIGANLTSRVTSAVAGTALPAGWSGQFNLSHGPCL